MNTSRAPLYTLLLVLASLGCGGDEGQPSFPKGGRQRGGDTNPCKGELLARPVGWNESTALGTSARSAFEPASGECRAPFSWNSDASDRAVEPRAGQTEVVVRVTPDESSARLREYREARDALCGPWLEVDADVSVATLDGTFVDRARTTMSFDAQRGVQALWFSRPVAELGGSLQIEVAPNEMRRLVYRLRGSAQACAGEVSLYAASQRETEHQVSEGRLAQWSNTGCPLDSEPARLDAPLSPALPSVRDLAARVLGERTFEGAWDDGTRSALSLQVAVEETTACRDAQSAIIIPVRARYGTKEGRVGVHDVAATLRVSSQEAGALGLQLHFSDELSCEAAPGRRLYAACDGLFGATLQLSMNISTDGVLQSGARLEVYEFEVDRSRSGAADHVRTLELDTP